MGLSKKEIEDAVADEGWQEFRISLKGMATKEKLKRLHQYLDDIFTTSSLPMKEIQVLNYLNALSRGGQILPITQVRGIELRQLFSDKKISINR